MDYDEARRRMEKWQQIQRKKLKRWMKIHWFLFTLNMWSGTRDVLRGNYWLAGFCFAAVACGAHAIYSTDKLLKQRFFERE